MWRKIYQQAIRPVFHRLGFDLTRHHPGPAGADYPPDYSPADIRIIESVRACTMTTDANLKALIDAVRHIVRHRIPGSFVECGVWKGGSSMAMALTLQECGETNRELYLYDTFTGMNQPTPEDVSADGHPALAEFSRTQTAGDTSTWCCAPLEEVTANLARTGYARERLHFVPGRVEDTIPATLPGQIALLRLDTDWYESTRHELLHLYPRLMPHGVLIVDDYGYWAGAKKAVEEFRQEQAQPLYLHRIDRSSRLAIKPTPPTVPAPIP